MLAAFQAPDLISSIEQINKELSEQILQAAYQNIPRKNKWVGPRGNPWWTTKCKETVKRKRKLCNTYLLLKKKQAKIDEISNVYIKMKEANVACQKKKKKKKKKNQNKNKNKQTNQKKQKQKKKPIAQAKLCFWTSAAREQSSDLTRMWKNLKILKRTYNPPEPDLLSSEGKPLKTANEKATAF